MLTSDFQSLGICFLVVLSFLKFTEFLADSHVLTSVQSRKVVHILTGPLYIALWPIYSNDPEAKFICAIVPLVVTLRFALIGLGLKKSSSFSLYFIFGFITWFELDLWLHVFFDFSPQ